MLLGFVSGAVVDESILEKFDDGEERVAVIVKRGTVPQSNFVRINSFSNGIDKIAENGNRYTAFVSRDELEILKSTYGVLNIQRNIPLKAFMQDAIGIVDADALWNLEIDGINLTGSSQSVCILDTGINNSHPDFLGRVLAEKCFCTVSDSGSGGCCPNTNATDDIATDDNGHGTHVAGIVGASGGVNGIATEVGLVIVRIMNGTGDGNSFDLENGMQWCIDNAVTYNISVITASLGAADEKTTSCDGDVPSTTAKINSAVAQNISVTIATGNYGWNNSITWPSCISNATPVGSVDKSDSVSSFSNRNSLLKLFAIGTSINSSCLVGNTGYVNGYCTKQGTSMATPMVAGAISILNQVLNLTGQSRTPLEVEDIFYNSGKTISELGNNYSRINVYDAILSVDNIAPNIILISPMDNKVNLTANQTFVCNTTDWQLANVTLKIWNSTGLYHNVTNNLTGTANETSFDLVDMPLGNYDWNCLVVDVEGNYDSASANYSLTIGGISVILVSPLNNRYTNINETNFTCESNSEATHELSNVTFYLWNSTGDLNYSLTKNVSGFDNTTIFNWTFVDEKSYSWNCLGVNNGSNESWGDNNFSITYDITVPNITLVGDLPTSETSNSVSKDFRFNISEENIANCSLIIGGVIDLTNSSVNVSVTQLFSRIFTPGTYNWKINCTDLAGKVNSSAENSFTITSVVVQNTGGGGSSSASAVFIPKTYEVSVAEITSGYTRSLKKDEKINFSVFDSEGGQHLLTIDKVDVDFVELTIESDPINLKLGIGQSVKLNLTSDTYYDLLVKLNNITGSSAELTIQLINEAIEVKVVEIIKEEIVETEVLVTGDYLKMIAGLVIALIISIGVIILLVIKVTKKIKRRRALKKEKKKNGTQNKKAKAKTKRKR